MKNKPIVSKKPTGRQKDESSRIPTFKNYQEEANWFDTHDMADYQDEFTTVKVRFARNLTVPLTIRFDEATLNELRVRARARGIGPTTLARMWVLERLQETTLRTAGE